MNLDAYLRRIDYSGSLTPSSHTLAALHLAHATHIPFENLDILLGKPIRLDLESLEQKLVTARRGGYCFEQNLLFAAVLEQLGFTLTRLIARVRYRASATPPRTHMVLLVDVDGMRWVADVGFGGQGLLLPVPFAAGDESRQYLWTYRVVPEVTDAVWVPVDSPHARWIMQSLHGGEWIDLYVFTLEPQDQIDYEVANHYTSTHPSSKFVRTLTAQLPGQTERRLLRNREFTIDRGAAPGTRELRDDAELLDVLADAFGLPFPVGTRFAFNDPR